jgi:hypothetical protein
MSQLLTLIMFGKVSNNFTLSFIFVMISAWIDAVEMEMGTAPPWIVWIDVRKWLYS